ncbi:autotransporter outer membrane beta-barrel domain-containing protein [Aquabacter spiritensis]|uniref:Outer membrane autotransporter protein n=1 Tax=Aquabacter spiritensis TaxID=933073 RepID=A0A4R3LYA6_9HYPH|nr:autotransporter outer membrane beta-barrel domain-containing protein [Aquabacter spiritensis]TCT05513.1 outer membrane autotransporter protein [Aquabacter spiritensis]
MTAGFRGRLLASCAHLPMLGIMGVLSGGLLACLADAGLGAGAQAASATPYTTLNYGTTGTFLTGIRGNTIVGNYVVPGTTATGGLLYNTSTGQWSAMPVATANGVNYPGAIGSSPYGPSFGNQGGVLRTVGSYITAASSPYDLSYLYDAASAPGQQLTELAYPSAPGNPTLYTIAHSTFGNTVVGNYDTRFATGNAMIYTISTGTYVTNNKPDAVSTTAYGVYGDMIAGGYANVGPGGGIGFEHGYLYDQVTGKWTTYDHPEAIITHLEGITGAGRSGEYNMVADWVTPDGVVHAGVLHVDALGIPTWYEINIPGATLVSSNSAYGDTVVGIYLLPGSTTPNGYVATIPGIYNPIRNTETLTSAATDTAALSGRKGDDIVNSGTVQMTGKGGVGMRGETFGVLTNTGTVVATGLVGAAVEMHGLYGTFLNYGTIQAPAVADALRTGPDSYGTVIVNAGIIDGRIAATAGPAKRFENSGWIGVTGTGIPITHLLSGIYAQTAAGTLSLRVGADGNDALGITGVARLAGTLEVPFQTSTLANSYTLLVATDGMTGTFTTLATSGLPSYVSAALEYESRSVALTLTSHMAQQIGLTANQSAVGGTVDAAFNSGVLTNSGTATAAALNGLYSLSGAQLGPALAGLSGEAYASERSVLLNDGLFTRQAVLGRLRQLAYGNAAGPVAALGYAGDVLAYSAEPKAAAAPGTAALARAANAPSAPSTPGLAMWATAYGSWGSFDGNSNASAVDTTLGGVVTGFDARIGTHSYLGVALGYSQSNSTIGGVASSAQADSGLIAAYAGTSFGAWNLRGGVSYTLSQVDTSRTILIPGLTESAQGQYNAGLTQVFGEIGYGMTFQSVAVEPFAGLAWAHLHTDGFTEQAAAVGLTAGSSASDVGYGTLGVRVTTDISLANGAVFTPRASVAWQYAFGDLTPTATLGFTGLAGSAFAISGVPLATNSALLDIGADLRISAALKLGVSYVGEFASSAQENAVKGTVTWAF